MSGSISPGEESPQLPGDWSYEFQRLHSVLEQQFARQHELLREVHNQVRMGQQRIPPVPSLSMTARKTSIRSSVIHEDSTYRDQDRMSQETNHESVNVGFAEPVLVGYGVGETAPSPTEEEEEEGITRQNENHPYEERPKRGRATRRDSARHSFVRRTLEAHQKKADKEASKLKYLRSRSTLNIPAERSWLTQQIEKLVSSKGFSNAIMMLILLNVILLGVEVDVSTLLGQNDVPKWFGTVNTGIVMLFVGEVALKCIAVGFTEYWCGHEACWNAFDALIITVSVFETIIDIWAQSMSADVANSSHLRVVRTIRLARALRGVRVVRLFRYVSALRTLALCIVSTIGSLIWTLVLLVLLFYTFGVILTQLVSDHCRDQVVMTTGDVNAVPQCTDDLQRYWASVPESMLTLFLAISGGMSWEDAFGPLRTASELACAFMILYIVIAVFAVLNVVTGVFCTTAIESANADKDVAAIKQLHKQTTHVQALRKIFHEIDADQCHVVSIEDLRDAISKKKLSSFLESMGISTEDLWTLFMTMDEDQTGLVGLEEFVTGCMQGRGPAKNLQLVKMSYENKVTRQAIKKISVQLAELSRYVVGLRAGGHPQPELVTIKRTVVPL